MTSNERWELCGFAEFLISCVRVLYYLLYLLYIIETPLLIKVACILEKRLQHLAPPFYLTACCEFNNLNIYATRSAVLYMYRGVHPVDDKV